jgi:hypothetical protein
MQQNNRASNARYLGQVNGGFLFPTPEDQYQPTAPLYVEQVPEQEPDAEELPDHDLAAQKTDEL